MAFVVPPIQSRPAFLPQDVPQTRRQELAGLGAAYGYGSPVFRDPAAVDYYQNLLANTLLSPNGSVVSEDLGNLISPAERFALSQQLGFRPETTTELFTALGLGQPDPLTGEVAPITREAIGDALKNFSLRNVPLRQEGGERQGAHPGRGDVTGIGAIAAPGFNEAMLGSQIAPAAAIAAGAPALAPAAAIGGLGLVGSSLAGALQDLTGRPGVLGPHRPAPGTLDFSRTVDAGRGLSGAAGDIEGGTARGALGANTPSNPSGHPSLGRAGSPIGGRAGGDGGAGPGGGRGSRGGDSGAADRSAPAGTPGGPLGHDPDGCFVAGTIILMADGTKKPIEKIKVGDKVMSFVNKGQLEEDKVYATFEHHDKEIFNLNGVLTTAEHPFLTEVGFKKVSELYSGQKLVTENGELFPVETLEKLPQKQRVYNIGVAKNQTYIADGYRVHNKQLAYGGMVTPMHDIRYPGYACGGMVKKHYADGGAVGEMIDPSMMGPPMQGDPTFMPNPQNGAGPDDLSITAQTGEYVVSKPAVQMFGPEFFDVLNDLAMKNPELDPKSVLKAASAVIPKPEAETKAQPGDLGARIGNAIGQGNFAKGGLIGSNPPRI